MKRKALFRYQDILLICFCAGVLLGTGAVNGFHQELTGQLGYFETISRSGQLSGGDKWLELMTLVSRQRFFEVGFAWLLGLTVFSVPCFYGLSLYAGINAGVVLSIVTMQKGLFGIFYYLLSLSPHFMIYIPVWCILAYWAGERNGKIRLPSLCALLLLTFIGIILESYVNPALLGVFL